ncbi:MAG: tripartite tricarboxylate transporter TctB family protein [Thermodesulfobacteriota bacterium]
MMTPNRLAALIVIAFGLGYGYLAYRQPSASALGDPGLSLFPSLLTILILLLAVTILVQDIRGKALPKRFAFQVTSGGIRSVIGLALVLAYFIIIPYLGFLISSFLLFASMMWLCGERRPVWIVGFSSVIPLLILLFFQELFQIPLPKLGLLEGVF